MAKVKIDALQKAVEKQLKDYTEDVVDGIKKAAIDGTKKGARLLKQSSPKDTGEYGKGWRSRTAYESQTELRAQVYNAKKPQIAHLLEDGHKGPYGKGHVAARPHIGQVEQKIVSDFEKEVEEILGK